MEDNVALSKQCLSVCSFAMAGGIVWSLGVGLLGLVAWQFSLGGLWVKTLASLYWGYDASLIGAFIGALWAFVDAFIGAAFLAWLYNKCLTCSAKCCPRNKCR
jgi:hypothetical protein